MAIYYCTIYIPLPSFCVVSDHYQIKNVSGNPLCVSVFIESIIQKQVYPILPAKGESLIPVSVFNGKKEGNDVNLFYDLGGHIFTLVLTCRQLHYKYNYLASFEQALYSATYNTNHFNLFQKMVNYYGHVNYAKSLNLPIRLRWVNYFLLINDIKLGCHDINGLLKLLYYQLIQ